MCNLRPVSLLISCLVDLSVDENEVLKSPLLLCYFWVLPVLLVFTLHIEVILCLVYIYLQLLYPLPWFIFWLLCRSFFSYNSLYFKVYFVWYGGFPGGSDGKGSAWSMGDWVWSLGQEDPLEKEMVTNFSSPMGSFLLPLQFWYRQILCMSFIHKIKPNCPSKSDSLKICSPFTGSLGWESWHGAQNIYKVGTFFGTIVLQFEGPHLAGIGIDFIFIAFLLPSHCSFFFVFGLEIFLWGRFHCPPVDGYSTTSWDFGALVGGGESTSFYFTILNQSSLKVWFCFLFFFFFKVFHG